MRALLSLVLLAALGWSGYWWVGSTAYQAGLDGLLEAQQDAGWKAERDDLRVVGYPNRFDTKITNLRLADPGGNWAWNAPEFQILSLSYKPNHIIAVWPGIHRFTTRSGSFEIAGERIRGSIVFAPDAKLPLDRLTLELEAARIGVANGPEVSIESGLVSTRRSISPNVPDYAHDLGLDIKNVRLPESFVRALGLRESLPREISGLNAAAVLLFDGPWDRTTLASPPRFLGTELESFSMTWGDAMLQASGRVDIDRLGFFNGSVALDVTNWRTILRALRELGVVDPQSEKSLQSSLGLIAGIGGEPKRLRIPLDFKDQKTFIGPFEIGPAPRLGQRQ